MAVPLLSRIRRKIIKDPETGCWLWQGGQAGAGYPVLRMGLQSQGNRRTELVHRLVYTIFVGDIPEGFDVDHTCGTKLCVNPDHLEAVTHKENIRRANFQRDETGKFVSKWHS